MSGSYFNTALSNTPIEVVAKPNAITFLNVENPGASKAYLQLHDELESEVTLGTSVPRRSFLIPAGGAYDLPKSFLENAVALTIAATTTPGGSTAPGTALLVNLDYTR